MTSIKEAVAEGWRDGKAEAADRKAKLPADRRVKAAKRGGILGVLLTVFLIGAWCVAAGIMLVQFGAWGWVVWPLMVWIWMHRIGFSVKQAVEGVKKEKDKAELPKPF